MTYKVELWDSEGVHIVHNFMDSTSFQAWVDTLPAGYKSLETVPANALWLQNRVHIVRGAPVLLEPVQVAKYTVVD